MGLAEVVGELVVLADEQVDVDVDRMFPAQLVGQRASGADIAGLQQAAVQVAADVGRGTCSSWPGQRKPSGNLEFGTSAFQSVAELLCGVRPEAVWRLAGQPAPRFDRSGTPLTGRRCGGAWRSGRPEDSRVLSAQAIA